ncbi:hypothetical protein RCL_jg17750.t1 [Rhizophagus clarus]|uniref:Uncharacterized protein n=1 Tax=Rhizophagus clarus TaxID=94130 RepID=A0A8H3L6M8_9GLOM|nr:hypothetical protein RCL_jg17750.t1 [Rhizophagus clarus]
MIQCFVAKIDAFIRGDPNNTFADALAPALDELPGDKGIRDMTREYVNFFHAEIFFNQFAQNFRRWKLVQIPNYLEERKITPSVETRSTFG